MNVYMNEESDRQLKHLSKDLSRVTIALMRTATEGVTLERLGLVSLSLIAMMNDVELFRQRIITYENASGITTDTNKNNEETND